jgi:hypothetical protein
MPTMSHQTLLVALLAATASTAAVTDGSTTIYNTGSPFGGPFGVIGFDVSSQQSIAVRFTPDSRYRLDRVGAWFMNNAAAGTHPLVTMTLRTDAAAPGGGSIPSQTILESWQFSVSATGWNPQLEQLTSIATPLLQAGQHYWLMAESSAPPQHNGVWNWSASSTGMMSICNGGNGCTWSPASSGAVVAVIVEGTPLNPADINGDGIVNVNDLLIVINSWGACPPTPQNCPADIAPPGGDGVVNVNDLLLVINNWG